VPTLLFCGPGGAGTSTLAAAAAVRAARSGSSTVLLSRQAPAVAGLSDVAGLRVVRVAPQAALERWFARSVAPLAAALPVLPVPPASSVVALPGMTELALLAELAAAPADVVVVDAGPPESATALLAAPAGLQWWLAQLLPPRLRVLGALHAAGLEPQSPVRAAADGVLAAIPAVEEALAGLSLGDPAATAVVLVAPPRPSALPVLRSAATALAVQGQRVRAVLTRELPDAAGAWWAARLEEQAAARPQLRELGPLLTVPETPAGPAEVESLTGLAVELPGAEEVATPAPERAGGGWRLVFGLPFAERGDVELTRWADDLVLTAAGSRRSVRLDSLLRRCTVTGASLRDPGGAAARLDVTFAPDPEQWPADLLSSHDRRTAEENA
jgi:arsenite-transporting ATPase